MLEYQALRVGGDEFWIRGGPHPDDIGWDIHGRFKCEIVLWQVDQFKRASALVSGCVPRAIDLSCRGLPLGRAMVHSVEPFTAMDGCPGAWVTTIRFIRCAPSPVREYLARTL